MARDPPFGHQSGNIIEVQKYPAPEWRDIVVAVRLDARHVELRRESTNPEHGPIAVAVVRADPDIDGIAVGALLSKGFNPVAAADAP